MKYSSLCLVAACLVGVGTLRATPVLTGPAAQCSTFAVDPSNPNDLAIQFAAFSAADFACEAQDKIYSNFVLGGLPDTSTLRIQLQPLVGVDFHTVTFNGNFPASFTLSYDIAIDLAISPLALITAVTGDMSNPTNVGAPSNLKTVFTEGGTTILTSVTALHVTDVYTDGGGAAVSISNTFREDLNNGAPEPWTYAMVGGGFLMLASLRKFRRS